MDVSKRISDVPEWFKGARLNYAENLLKHTNQDKVALYAASEYKSCVGVRGEKQHAVKPHGSWTAVVFPSITASSHTRMVQKLTLSAVFVPVHAVSYSCISGPFEARCQINRLLSAFPICMTGLCTVAHV